MSARTNRASGVHHARPHQHRSTGCAFCYGLRVRARLRRSEAAEGGPRMIGNLVLLTLAAILLVYLVYALLRPEKF
jgi:K+-transporting ATPase KdpF subunit